MCGMRGEQFMFVLQHLLPVASIGPVVDVHSRGPGELVPVSSEMARHCRDRLIDSLLGAAAGHERGLHRAIDIRVQVQERLFLLVRSTKVAQHAPTSGYGKSRAPWQDVYGL